MPKKKVEIDENECIGCGACFTEGLIGEGDGRARVLREYLKDDESFDPDVCPTGALRVKEEP